MFCAFGKLQHFAVGLTSEKTNRGRAHERSVCGVEWSIRNGWGVGQTGISREPAQTTANSASYRKGRHYTQRSATISIDVVAQGGRQCHRGGGIAGIYQRCLRVTPPRQIPILARLLGRCVLEAPEPPPPIRVVLRFVRREVCLNALRPLHWPRTSESIIRV